ncbi:hypothetical protein SEPCBS57363_006807, partial [Sporothrix epigloea]
MLDRCEETVERTGRPLLQWLSSSKSEQTSNKPFYTPVRGTRMKYRRAWKRCLAFVFRCYQLSTQQRRCLTGQVIRRELLAEVESIWNHPLWRLIDTSTGRWPAAAADAAANATDLQLEAQQTDEDGATDVEVEGENETSSDLTEEDEEEQDEEKEDEEYDEEEFEEERDEEETLRLDDQDESELSTSLSLSDEVQQAADEVLELLFHLSMTISTETLIDGQPNSTILVYFSGILGFTAGGQGFALARNYTTTLSALIYVQRLLLLEWTLPVRPYPYLGRPERPRMYQLDVLNTVRRASLVHGCDGPFDELFSLRNFGRVWAKEEPPAVFLRWSDDGEMVTFDDKFELSMREFRMLADHFITTAQTLCSRLMC